MRGFPINFAVDGTRFPDPVAAYSESLPSPRQTALLDSWQRDSRQTLRQVPELAGQIARLRVNPQRAVEEDCVGKAWRGRMRMR
jgi:hypothetical protein